MPQEKSLSHAFVMLVDARRQELYYYPYALGDFWANTKKFELEIGNNYFSLECLHLDMDNGKDRIRAELKFQNIHPWPVSLFSPGAMGWYAFVPMMECYHATASFDHDIDGYFEVNGMKTDFTLGKGYLEKDWGRSMPSSWIWMQTNHFDEDGVSLFGSVARIPWLGSCFTGFVFGFLYQGRLFRFATYTGAQIEKIFVSSDWIEITVRDKKFSLEISSARTLGIDIPAPKLGEMSAKVNESLKSSIIVNFCSNDPDGKNAIFAGTGRNAGLEFVGDIEELVKGIRQEQPALIS
jgi:hypothetical protein